LLTGEGFSGDYLESSFYHSLYASQRRVDRYAANATNAGTNLTQGKDVDVKIAGGFGPILFEPSQLSWLRKPTQEGVLIAANQFVRAMVADELNTAIMSLVAALENVAAVTTDVSGSAGMSQGLINDSLAKFGDASQRIQALVMTGAAYHKLVGAAITNSNSLFEIGGVAVREGTAFGQGRPIVVTDAPALSEAGTPDKMKVLGLVAGAAMVRDGGDSITNIQNENGSDRIKTSFQTDYTFGLGLKGYAWDTVNGGKSPLDAELATGSNWDATGVDIKASAGVIAVADAAL